MQIKRRFTQAGKSPYDKIPFRRATSEIRNPDDSVVFRLEGFAGNERLLLLAHHRMTQLGYPLAERPKETQ